MSAATKALGLDQDVVARHRDFYGALAVSDFPLSTASDRLRIYGYNDSRRPWSPADLAAVSARRRAVEFSILLDDGDAVSRISELGANYIALGMPYGHFLSAVFTPEWQSFDFPDAWPEVLARAAEPTEDYAEEIAGLAADALRHPAQRMYLSLAALASSTRSGVSEVLGSLTRSAARPIGPQGVRLEEYAKFASSLLGDGGSEIAAGVLARLASIQAERMAWAQLNEQMWQQLYSGVGLIDLDQVAFTVILVRHTRGPTSIVRDPRRATSVWAGLSLFNSLG